MLCIVSTCFQCLTDYKKRYEQQHEQENVWRRGHIIHQFSPAFRVRGSRTAQDTVNQEDTQDYPQSTQANLETATSSTHPHRKTPAYTETNPWRPKVRQTMGEHQKRTCRTLDQ